jgi:hypothetical protein
LDQGYFSGIIAFFLPAYEEVLLMTPLFREQVKNTQRVEDILGKSTFNTREVIEERREIEIEGITPPSTLNQIQSQI